MQGPFNFKKNTLGFAFWSHPRDPLTMSHFGPPDSKRRRRGEATSGGGGLATDFHDLWQVLEWAF